jgi:hypothetical protein
MFWLGLGFCVLGACIYCGLRELGNPRRINRVMLVDEKGHPLHLRNQTKKGKT